MKQINDANRSDDKTHPSNVRIVEWSAVNYRFLGFAPGAEYLVNLLCCCVLLVVSAVGSWR